MYQVTQQQKTTVLNTVNCMSWHAISNVIGVKSITVVSLSHVNTEHILLVKFTITIFIACIIHMYFLADYEFQVGIIEALFRLSNKSDRAAYARDCFTNKDCLEAFFQIRDSDFETVCDDICYCRCGHSKSLCISL